MVKCTGRGLVVKRPGVLSKVQMLNLVLGVGVFSLLPTLQRCLGPFKKVSKMSPGACGPETQKVSKKSREQSGKSLESLRKVSKESLPTVPRLFGDFSGCRGRRPRGTFLGLLRQGPTDLCKPRGELVPKTSARSPLNRWDFPRTSAAKSFS